jgi:hypothetical protein
MKRSIFFLSVAFLLLPVACSKREEEVSPDSLDQLDLAGVQTVIALSLIPPAAPGGPEVSPRLLRLVTAKGSIVRYAAMEDAAGKVVEESGPAPKLTPGEKYEVGAVKVRVVTAVFPDGTRLDGRRYRTPCDTVNGGATGQVVIVLAP